MQDTNSHNLPVIKEICRTQTVSYTDNVFTCADEYGAKLKCTSTGDVEVQYIKDADGTWRILKVQDTDNWLPDRIKRIRSTNSTVPAVDILIGW